MSASFVQFKKDGEHHKKSNYINSANNCDFIFNGYYAFNSIG